MSKPSLMNDGTSKDSVDDANTNRFITKGVGKREAEEFLNTLLGQRYSRLLADADPSASDEEINRRAIGQLTSGAELPRLAVTTDPLYKIVPSGAALSPHSPYFTTLQEIEKAYVSGTGLIDQFGLPLASTARAYDIYSITPKEPIEVFVSRVAPTSELDGQVTRSGGALQPYLARHW